MPSLPFLLKTQIRPADAANAQYEQCHPSRLHLLIKHCVADNKNIFPLGAGNPDIKPALIVDESHLHQNKNTLILLSNIYVAKGRLNWVCG